MLKLSKDLWLGAGVVAFGVFLLLVLIPVGITSPNNVRVAVLSPTMWPNIIAAILILIGVILILRAFIAGTEAPDEHDQLERGWQSWIRIAVVAGLMAALYFALPRLGMPLVTGIAFLAYGFLVRQGRPIVTVTAAILLPLMIYGFFNHVAGVPVPQGKLVRLP